MRFKKGELTKESFKVIMYDLEMIMPKDEQTKYHYNLLKGNIKDIWGV